jgi:hypothetical protein
MTDRYVYRPGEDLWFKGFTVTNSYDPGQSYSDDFFIRLVNINGEEIIYRRYPLINKEADGRIVIPRSCIPGKYWLIGYTGWMKNQCPEEAFRKEILISKYYEKRFTVEVLYDKLSYCENDTLIAHIQILDPAGRPVSEISFDYMIGTLNKPGNKSSGVTDIKGKAKITGQIPSSDEILTLTIGIRSRKLSGSFSHIIPSVSGQPDITFYPEGGSLVAGLKNMVAIKATNKYHLPEIISGIITNALGDTVCTVSTEFNGKGKFEYLPTLDTFFLKITGPQRNLSKYMLPVATNSGTIISYHESADDTARFQIFSTHQGAQKAYCIAVMNRKIVWSNVLSYEGTAKVKIPLNNISAGILQVTVFGQDHKPACERFISVTRGKLPAVKMQQNVYHSRQRVSLMIDLPEQISKGNLSMSVSLDNLTHNSQSADFNALLNSSPCNAPINAEPTLIQNDLDLLTNDFSGINWNHVLQVDDHDVQFDRHDGLTGIVFDKRENLSQHAKVRVTHFPNFRLYETQTDENGVFHIGFGSDIIDYKFLNIDAYDALGKVNLNTKIDYSYIDELSQSLVVKSKNDEQLKIRDLKSYGEPDLVYVLRYGPGKLRKVGTDNRKKYDPYQYARYTDIMDIIQDIQPYKITDNKIIFTDRNRTKTDSSAMEESIIVINGVLKGSNVNAFKGIAPSDITNINISNYLVDVHKYTPLSFGGVIEITTIQGMYRYRQTHFQMGPGILSAEREFYSPDYSVESSYSSDNRRTLYWNPKILPDQKNSILITFYTSDVKGLFYGRIVGDDNNGNPVEATFTFRVE